MIDAQLPTCISQEMFNSLTPQQKDAVLAHLQECEVLGLVVESAKKRQDELVLTTSSGPNAVVSGDVVFDSMNSIISLADKVLDSGNLPLVVKSLADSIRRLAHLAMFESEELSATSPDGNEMAVAVSAALRRLSNTPEARQLNLFRILENAAKKISGGEAKRDQTTMKMVELVPLAAGSEKKVPQARLQAIWDAPSSISRWNAINDVLRCVDLQSTSGETLRRICDAKAKKMATKNRSR